MNESIDIYTQFGIDRARLKRDYIENPLKKVLNNNYRYVFEQPELDDLYYFFAILKLKQNEVRIVLNITEYSMRYFYKLFVEYNAKKSLKELFEKYNVDINRLNRDYINNPLKRSEYIEENDFRYLYLEKNLSRFEIAEIFNISYVKVSRHQKRYNINKDIDKLMDNAYKTNLKKYGTKHPSQLKEIKDKIRQTNLKKIGREYNTQKHIPLETLEIINNKEKLKTYIIDNNIQCGVELSEQFGVNSSGIERKIKDFGLDCLFDYSKSLPEKELKEYINQYYETENNTKKYLNGKEIDIYIPEKKIGIEFNGNYWHSEYYKDKCYHQEKSKLAEEQGIFIYHIFEYEWNTKKERIINQLNNLLKVNSQKIGARSCIIKEVSNKEKSQFLEENHLQGNDRSSIKLGLYYNNGLVSLMTFCKPRFNKNYEWELSRFCSKSGCNVIGGASKLFSYFIKTYNPKSIISYSNIAHTRGNLYKMLGMNLLQISEPNYVWCKSEITLTRYQCQKHNLLEQGYEGDSEVDIMHNRGYYRIYDCGNKVWAWNNKKEV